MRYMNIHIHLSCYNSSSTQVEMYVACLLLSLLPIANGYKVLFLVPFPGTSHWLTLQNFAKELMNRGHEVTAIVNTPINDFSSPNYTEILINPPYATSKILSQQEAIDSADSSDFQRVRDYQKWVSQCSEHGLTTSNVQKIIHSEDLHFDLVIDGNFFHESWIMFAHKFDAPIVSICPYGYSDFFDRAMGLLTPWSHVPHMLLSFGDDMTYSQRVYNEILSLYDWWYRNWVMLERQNGIAQKYFAHLAKPGKPLPHIADLYKNISLFLVNVHKSISKPRPQRPGIVHFGGAYVKAPKPLPAHLQAYIDNSAHGVILFSLGSHLQSSKLPKEKIDVFLNDILPHPNVVLFITHGGTSRGVPMLFIPFFADQSVNALRAERNGNALMLPFPKLTHQTLSDSVNKVLTTDSHKIRAKEVARLFNDNLVHPMDEATFWIEYVMRSNGAKHLKSNAVNMSWFSYLLLDIFALPIAIISIAYILVKLFLRPISKTQQNVKVLSNGKKKHK